jgi:hypothetical protein
MSISGNDRVNYFLSDEVKRFTRQIDMVTVKGSIVPIGFYTIDMEVDNLPVSKDPATAYSEFSSEELQLIENDKKAYVMVYSKLLTYHKATYRRETVQCCPTVLGQQGPQLDSNWIQPRIHCIDVYFGLLLRRQTSKRHSSSTSAENGAIVNSCSSRDWQ